MLYMPQVEDYVKNLIAFGYCWAVSDIRFLVHQHLRRAWPEVMMVSEPLPGKKHTVLTRDIDENLEVSGRSKTRIKSERPAAWGLPWQAAARGAIEVFVLSNAALLRNCCDDSVLEGADVGKGEGQQGRRWRCSVSR